MIDWTDWAIWTLYFTVFYFAVWFYRSTKANVAIYEWFLKGYLIKVFGGVIFVLVSVYYYRGDTILYFEGANVLSNYLFEDPMGYFRLLFAKGDLSSEFHEITSSISYSKTSEEWFMVKILSVFCLLSCNSYLVLTLFMSTIAFWGAWKLFKVFSDVLHESKGIVFVIVFLTPSVLFWGTGILKDTITLALLNYIIYVIYILFVKQKMSLSLIGLLLIAGYIIYSLKSYIILAFLPTLIFVFYSFFKNRIRSNFIRLLATPIIFIVLGVSGFFTIQKLSENTVYSSENIQTNIKGFHSWHTTTGGSSYNLGEVEFTLVGITKKIPAALNVNFFRPYLWEARNLTSLIGALESTVILLSFIYILISVWFTFFKRFNGSTTRLLIILLSILMGFAVVIASMLISSLNSYSVVALSFLLIVLLTPFVRLLKTNKLLWGLMIFVLIFGFAIGFTSYNFGALSRYKMPIISIYTYALLYVYKRNKALT